MNLLLGSTYKKQNNKSIMDYETKSLLKRSINEFLVSDINQQEEMIEDVRKKLKIREKSFKQSNIEEDQYIKASEVFLRLFDYRQEDLTRL